VEEMWLEFPKLGLEKLWPSFSQGWSISMHKCVNELFVACWRHLRSERGDGEAGVSFSSVDIWLLLYD